MDPAITDEILEELSSTLQRVEAQSSAILEFVKDKGIVKEDELAAYLERANAASSVRWRATRVRLERLFSGFQKKQQQQNEERKKAQQDQDKQKNEEQNEATRGHEAGMHEDKADGPKTAAKREPEEEKPQAKKAKPTQEDERQTKKEPAQAPQPQASDRNQGSAQPKQRAHAKGVGDSAVGREQESRPDDQEKRAKTGPTSTEQSSDKSKSSDAA